MEAREQRKRMLNMSIPKLITKLSIPTIISQLITVIYNTADTFFVSKIDDYSASAAVGIVFSLQSIIQALGCGFAMGAGSLVSIRLGQKKEEEANKIATSGFVGAMLCGFLIMIFGLSFLEPLMLLLGSTNTTLPYCMGYAKYLLIVAPIYCGQFVFNNILRSEGESNHAMIGITTGGILNLALDPLLIFKFNLGIEGAAIATAISQTVSFFILSIMMIKKSIVRIKIRYISKNIGTYGLIISTGMPTVFRQGMGSLATALLNNQIKVYGNDAAIAAISIINKMYMLIRNIVLGFGQGFIPVAGYNYGANRLNRVKKAFRFTTFVGSIVCISFSIMVFLFRREIIMIFRSEEEIISIGSRGLLFYVASIPLLAFSTFVNQLYQCLGFKVRATFLATCRQGVFYIPFIFILPFFFGIDGILACQSLSDICTFLISIPFLIYFFKHYLNTSSIDEDKYIQFEQK